MSHSKGAITRRLVAFASAIKKKPDLLNYMTGCVLFAGSDAIAQELESDGMERILHPEIYVSGSRPTTRHTDDSNTKGFDILRLVSSALLGVFFGGLVYPKAYAVLDRLWPGVQARQVLTKSIVEIFSVGIFVNSVSIGMRGLLVGRSVPDVQSHVAKEIPRVTLNDVRVWLPYNLLAFGLIPSFIRPTTTAMMESAWQTYISLHSHNYHQHQSNLSSSISELFENQTDASPAKS